MPHKPLASATWKAKTRPEKEATITRAIRDYGTGRFSHYIDCSVLHDVPYGTFVNRLTGATQQHTTAHEHENRLSGASRAALTVHIDRMITMGFPPIYETVRLWAEQLRTFQLDYNPNEEPIGVHWPAEFIGKHEALQLKWVTARDSNRRAVEGNPWVLKEWFKLLEKTMQELDIVPPDTYNMDETGYMLGIADRVHQAVCRRSAATAQFSQPGAREWVTVIEAINAAGAQVPPYVIFKAKQMTRSLLTTFQARFVDKAFLAITDNGWSDKDNGMAWLQHFNATSPPSAPGRWRLLIMDGHSTHKDLEFINYSLANRIQLICLPSHSTHLLQPLDVGIFGPLKAAYSSTLLRLMAEEGLTQVNKEDFLEVYTEMRAMVFDKLNITASFRATGISPVDAQAVLSKLPPTLTADISPPAKSNATQFAPSGSFYADENAPPTPSSRALARPPPTTPSRQPLKDLSSPRCTPATRHRLRRTASKMELADELIKSLGEGEGERIGRLYKQAIKGIAVVVDSMDLLRAENTKLRQSHARSIQRKSIKKVVTKGQSPALQTTHCCPQSGQGNETRACKAASKSKSQQKDAVCDELLMSFREDLVMRHEGHNIPVPAVERTLNRINEDLVAWKEAEEAARVAHNAWKETVKKETTNMADKVSAMEAIHAKADLLDDMVIAHFTSLGAAATLAAIDQLATGDADDEAEDEGNATEDDDMEPFHPQQLDPRLHEASPQPSSPPTGEGSYQHTDIELEWALEEGPEADSGFEPF
ncbi:unnamed protein product [Zymoseptoria tritici ST99CH_1A5]|uniref:DDE-1 domain-containing protein n=1 Tax=Zymoseptoria tritici ST99CH_1A5 TaxID=1276529 RepID=A0A1Y6LG83_ZYMTR|nr:unnamed protein product [Zymoseptoria tritici ST99CH_1A5]SMY22410.1 unnamed protein product [Zymoseptoria tritici ST99CH_1A5]SMY27764.1 unnamed protein product [Zymoseptoria tritici ST99CH_1A5]